MTLYCATGNPGKVREFQLAAASFGRPLERLAAYGSLPVCEETGSSFEENAVQKALYYAPHAPGPLFAEDSGLEVDALGGAPGIFSARYAGAGATDAANNRLLLEKMRDVENRAARYVCVIALSEGPRLLGTFRGTVEGRILDEERGSNGFGYDPLFYYPPFGCTFAEITPERKFTVSHRGQAFRKLLGSLAA